MKKMIAFGLTMVIIAAFSACETTPHVSTDQAVKANSQSGTLPKSEKTDVDLDTTQALITGKVSKDREYSGQDCVQYNDSLYWTESKGYVLSTGNYQLVGTIQKMVDKVPDENYTSAKSEPGSKIYVKKDDDDRIFVEGELEPGKQVLISFVRRSLK